MDEIKSVRIMQEISNKLHTKQFTIGLVPTMGYLHEGHLSLIRVAKKKCNIVVVSIFVNPTQFAPNEDLDKYPRDIKQDLELCYKEEVDYVFIPEVKDIYPNPFLTKVSVKSLSNTLCGKSRPTHFDGVTTIVNKLFNIVKPHIAIFGQKDFQQLQVIKKMVKDLNIDVEIIGSPIIREKNGLAMSSRNKYLNSVEREQALILQRSLSLAKEEIIQGNYNSKSVKDKMVQLINTTNAIIDYIEIVDAESLEAIPQIKNNSLIALAAKFGQTRLIDNIFLQNINKEETWQ